MYGDQNAGQSQNMKTDCGSFERVEEFKYFGTALTKQNSIKKEIKSRLKSGNAGYHSVQNILCSSALSKNVEIKVDKTIILPVLAWVWNMVTYSEGEKSAKVV
jgi:UDP-N-acetylmuramyl pentapeptide synthase